MFTQRVLVSPLTAADTVTGNSKVRHKQFFKRNGFTLIEMLIVFTLIGILVGLGIPQFTNAAKRARESVLKEDLFQFRKLIEQYRLDKGKYPPTLQSLVEEGYLRQIPVDPITKSADTWIEVPETLSEENLLMGVQPGIYDVHSGSDLIGTDGTPYNTW
ncbi:MAG: prepilin-type N-terminal cleavage/methylation domain-containing protein [Candidatus Aminicenantes bacterium]|nr:prepilin-type N-terminal cleavage/methylation domain-containing protein [Candidatus Aminicenantes bacterium]